MCAEKWELKNKHHRSALDLESFGAGESKEMLATLLVRKAALAPILGQLAGILFNAPDQFYSVVWRQKG